MLACDYTPDAQIRIIMNDGVVPLGSVRGCSVDEPHGLCPVPTFVEAVRETVAKTDWAWACLGDWEVPLPPPVQPPPPTFAERTWAWAEEHPWRTGCLAAGVVGGGLLVGYGGIYLRTVRARRAKASSAERRQVVGRCL